MHGRVKCAQSHISVEVANEGTTQQSCNSLLLFLAVKIGWLEQGEERNKKKKSRKKRGKGRKFPYFSVDWIMSHQIWSEWTRYSGISI